MVDIFPKAVDHGVDILGESREPFLDGSQAVRALVSHTVGLMQEHGCDAVRRKADFVRCYEGNVHRVLEERAAVAAYLALEGGRSDVQGAPYHVLARLVELRESLSYVYHGTTGQNL